MTLFEHCRVAVFAHMIVVLDLKKSKYVLYDAECAKNFSNYYLSADKPSEAPALGPLIADGIVNAKSLMQPQSSRNLIADYRTMRFETFDTGSWGSRTLGYRGTSNLELLPLARIVGAAISLKFLGMDALLALDRLLLRQTGKFKPEATNPTGIIDKYLHASLWSPIRITCLPLSFSVVAELIRNNIPAQLVIGVRPTPFVAHAWVEIDQRVCGDDPTLKDCYGEIYRTPRDHTQR